MEPKQFSYTGQFNKNGSGFTYRPLIDVEVGNGNQKASFKALIDSGSDITIMDKFIADLLQIDSSKCRQATVSGIEAEKVGFVAPVSLIVESIPDIRMDFNVLFVESVGKNFEIILGQDDFFRRFNVTFRRSEKVFYLG